MKGIILAGGTGSRLYPLTKVTSKQLLPVYDKPMIYYPLSTLMLAGIREIMIISTPKDLQNFKKLLGSGKKLGSELHYKEQPSPDGLAQAFLIAEEFIRGAPCAMILGDNIFYGNNFENHLQQALFDAENGIATIFGYQVTDPQRFGIVEFDDKGAVMSVEEKPKKPKSNYCITGLYFYDECVVDYAKTIKPSHRGELEITDLNRIYLEQRKLKVQLLGRGFAWLDTGTMDSLIEASTFVQMMSKRQNIIISAPEEIAFDKGWIDEFQLLQLANEYENSPYGQYLKKLGKRS